MSHDKLFHTMGPATQNARLPRRRLVRGTTRSPRAAEKRTALVETVVTVNHLADYYAQFEHKSVICSLAWSQWSLSHSRVTPRNTPVCRSELDLSYTAGIIHCEFAMLKSQLMDITLTQQSV